MHLNTRVFRLFATVVSAFALMFASTPASADEGPVIGTLTYARGCTVLVNGRQQPSGYAVHAGDAIKTSASCKANVRLANGYGYGGRHDGKAVIAQGDNDDAASNGGRGGVIVIDPATRVRLYLEGNSIIAAVLIGGVHYYPGLRPGPDEDPALVDGSGSGADPLPFLAAFGFGNFSFPSIGGGGATNNNRIPVRNSAGVIVGYVLTNSSGVVIGFTDPLGNVLGVGNPGGTPVSGVFGPGATI
jgi:hypothetical protein